MTKPDTALAPAERVSDAEVRRQNQKLAALPFVSEFLDAVPNMALILNPQRQIVFANQPFADFLGLGGRDELLGLRQGEAFGCLYAEVLGQRPGEAVGCIRARLTEGGCGTTEFCRSCGAVISILNSQRNQAPDVQECRMIRGESGAAETALDLRVWSRPITVDGETFTVFSVVDISDEKRRKVLERIFFHDVLNTAGGVKGVADILKEAGLPPDEVRELAGLISESADQLVDEIRTQQMLSSAESGDLEVNPEPLESLPLLERLLRHVGSFSCAKNKTVRIADDAEDFTFSTDPALLRRVLINLIKNALEAVKEGETVTIGCHRRDGRACFTVHDTPVIPAEVQLQLFMRSFSTKGKDRGLGTYSIKLITEKYLKGRVSFVSEAPQGTVFTVCCPLTPP